MPDFSSEAELKRHILKEARVAVNSVADKVYDIIHGVLENFYSSYDPYYYIRTERLLKSLVKTRAVPDGDGYTAEVYFDVSKLDYPLGKVEIQEPFPNGKTYGYATWSGSKVLDAAMDGSNVRTWRNPTSIWGESFPKIDSKAIDMLVKELRAAGVPLQ